MPLAPVLDAAFLRPFTLPNAEALARILADLYAETRRASQPLAYEVALDILIKHTLTPGDDDPLPRAEAVLAELQADGWLRVAVQPDYVRAVVLTRPAFQLLQSAQVSSPSVPELLVTVHDLLKAALLDVGNDARLSAALRVTDALLDALKALQHTTAETAPLPDTSRLRAAITDAAAKLEARGHAPARLIRQQFEFLGNLFDDIAARRPGEPGTRDLQPSAAAAHLRAYLPQLAAADRKTFAKQVDSLIHLYHLPPASPQPPAPAPAPPAAFTPVDWPAPQLSDEEIAAARRGIQQQLNRPISPSRLQRLAAQLVESKPFARAADLVAEGRADLPLLIQLRLHADSGLGYSLEEGQWVETNGLVFRDFNIKNPNYIPPFTADDLATVLSGAAEETPAEADSPPPEAEPAG